MSKNRVTFLLTTALAVATVGLAPAVAHAEAAPASGVTAAAADGNLYAWEHAYEGGRVVSWSGDSSDWADRDMRNKASSVFNNGYAGAYDDVLLYWDVNHGGASFRLCNGSRLRYMPYDFFNHNGAGGGETLNDNVASHRWTNAC
ncbi:peptidase inhibitor family I36 protein [Streptomyces sp. NPDC093546]|uniref:peptidase inhibitor family I36 protein n=1 Tax=Streptomyces sp. NPDC093546 TaxID=3366040 RepID=UPI003800C18D